MKNKKHISWQIVYCTCMSFAYIGIGVLFMFVLPPGDMAGSLAAHIMIGIIMFAYGICRGLWGWKLIHCEYSSRKASHP